jgi:hypothetical protein
MDDSSQSFKNSSLARKHIAGEYPFISGKKIIHYNHAGGEQ